MIKININKDFDIINSIHISGHSKYDIYGKDIVCSAVSTLVITSINIILKIDKDSISYIQKDGFIDLKIIKNNDITNIIINNMVDMLIDLEKQYSKNIKIII